MNTLNKQRGMSMWQIMILVPMVGFYLFLAIKIGPEYMNHMTVVNAIDGVAHETRNTKPSKIQMRQSISKRLNVNFIEFVKKEDIVFKDEQDGTHIIATYNREVPLFANVFVTLKFKHDARVKQHSVL